MWERIKKLWSEVADMMGAATKRFFGFENKYVSGAIVALGAVPRFIKEAFTGPKSRAAALWGGYTGYAGFLGGAFVFGGLLGGVFAIVSTLCVTMVEIVLWRRREDRMNKEDEQVALDYQI